MKIYEGRIEPYSVDDYLGEGSSREQAEARFRSQARSHHRVFVHDECVPRRYPIVPKMVDPEGALSWGFRGAGPTNTARSILWDLFNEVIDDQDTVYDLIANLNEAEDFDLTARQILAALERRGIALP